MNDYLGEFISKGYVIREQSQRLIYFWWKVHCRVVKRKAEEEAKKKAAAQEKEKEGERKEIIIPWSLFFLSWLYHGQEHAYEKVEYSSCSFPV